MGQNRLKISPISHYDEKRHIYQWLDFDYGNFRSDITGR
jgi:hypothetical protein